METSHMHYSSGKYGIKAADINPAMIECRLHMTGEWDGALSAAILRFIGAK